MLEMEIVGEEGLDETTNTFTYGYRTVVHLEHSLLSLSEWESKYEKPFLNKEKFETEEFRDYIRFMCVDPEGFPEEAFEHMGSAEHEKITKYIGKKSTATFFKEVERKVHGKPAKEIITSELIYYWMVGFQIPFTAETWNLNRLLTLIRVCEEKSNKESKKVNKRDALRRRRELNNRRLSGKP